MRSYFGEEGAQIHARLSGEGAPVLFLPPAPHTGAYFDTLASYLDGVQMIAVDYPGYGGSDRVDKPTIGSYAEALSPHVPGKAVLVGFHTGNLVAAEIAKRSDVSRIVMIDIPYFDAKTRRNYADKLPDPAFPSPIQDDHAKTVVGRAKGISEARAFALWVETLRAGGRRSDAFRAAFAYDPEVGLSDLSCPVSIIATDSGLLEPTRRAAHAISVSLIERMDVRAPVFEAHPKEMAETILGAIRGEI